MRHKSGGTVSVLTAIPYMLSLAILYSLITSTLYHPPASFFISLLLYLFVGFVQAVPWKKTPYNISYIPYMISSSPYVHGITTVASLTKERQIRGGSKTHLTL
jgi:hypothetical protein